MGKIGSPMTFWSAPEDAVVIRRDLSDAEAATALRRIGSTRTANAVRQRRHWLAKGVANKGAAKCLADSPPWTAEEDLILLEARGDYNVKLAALRRAGFDRNWNDLRHHWRAIHDAARRAPDARCGPFDPLQNDFRRPDWPESLRFEDQPGFERVGVPVWITRRSLPRSAASSLEVCP